MIYGQENDVSLSLSLVCLRCLTAGQHTACMHRIVSLRQHSIQREYQLTIHEADQSLHEVVHELERAGLLAVAVDSDILPLQRLFSECM
jgi:hypothetical protein